MTICYLGWSPTAMPTLERHRETPVSLLVAYPDLKAFQKHRGRINIKRWCLDSGAFSAWNSGKTIKLPEYIAAAKDCDACEVFGLDVIGDAEATRHNLDAMWNQGMSAIPTFHYRAKWEWLAWCCEHSDKIALGGMAKERGSAKWKWIEQCFARCWPKKVHGFGVASPEAFALVPFHSVDATSWSYAPSAMGCWAGFTGRQMRLKSRGVKDYWIEVQEHQRRERLAIFRWRRQLASLEVAK
jgi:hypothetical protein